jgi:hypothetical protein
LKRQWNRNQTLPYWAPPELDTAVEQLSGSWLLAIGLLINSHFKTHLSIGGYAGHMSVAMAAYE